LTRPTAPLYSSTFRKSNDEARATVTQFKPTTSMANPKRKQSKRRSANRRAANALKAPEFAKDPADGSIVRAHRVNPKTGMYRGRQVLDVQV